MEKNVENDFRQILGLKEGEKVPAPVEQLYTSVQRAASRANIPFGRPQELLMLCLIADPKSILRPAEPEKRPPDAGRLQQGKG